MQRHYTCPQGHRWQLSVEGELPESSSWIVCPMCGFQITALASAEATTVMAADHPPFDDDPDLRRPRRWPIVLAFVMLAMILVVPAGLVLTLIWGGGMRYQHEMQMAMREADMARAMAQEQQARAEAERQRAQAAFEQVQARHITESNAYYQNIARAEQELAAGKAEQPTRSSTPARRNCGTGSGITSSACPRPRRSIFGGTPGASTAWRSDPTAGASPRPARTRA